MMAVRRRRVNPKRLRLLARRRGRVTEEQEPPPDESAHEVAEERGRTVAEVLDAVNDVPPGPVAGSEDGRLVEREPERVRGVGGQQVERRVPGRSEPRGAQGHVV